MKEFIEKLIGRLEETDFNDIQMVVREVLLKYGFPYESIVQDEVWDALDELSSNKYAISIVNQLAEEYFANTPQNFADGWIPCSERLPETYDNLLICQSDGYVNVGWYSLNEFKDVNSIPYKNVIAWQPLPQPYKENENGKV